MDLTIFGNGVQTRDFIHVKDIVAALVHAAIRLGLHGTSMTVNNLAAEIIGLSGFASNIIHLLQCSGDINHSRVSIDKLLATGFRRVSSLEHGIAEPLAAFRVH